MTETSYYHNGIVRGDASLAPYSSTIFQNTLNNIYNSSGGYIIPDTSGGLLNVTFVAGQDVRVASGKAFVEGVYFTNSANVDFTLENNTSGNPRLDMVVIRVDWEAQTARLAILTGDTAVIPTKPELTQTTGTTYEVPLALMYIPDSFTGFGNSLIYDQRQFANTPQHNELFHVSNIMHNSEFMSGHDTGADTESPAMWELTGGPATIRVTDIGTTGFDKTGWESVTRGNIVQAVLFPVGAILQSKKYLRAGNTSWFTIALMIEVSDATDSIDISIDGGATSIYKFYRTTEPILVLIRTVFNSVNPMIELAFENNSSDTVSFSFSQVTITNGIVAAPFVPNKEIILFGTPKPRTNWGPFATGTSEEDFMFGQMGLPLGINALRALLVAYDSGSAGTATAYISLSGSRISTTYVDLVRIELGSLTNNTRRYETGFIPLEQPNLEDGVIGTDRVASGGSSITSELYYTGIIT